MERLLTDPLALDDENRHTHLVGAGSNFLALIVYA
jgi:hypothetical protein